MIGTVRRWLPEKMLVLVTDGGLTAVKLGLRCARYANPVTYISRLRLDAVLHDPPGLQPRGKRGPKPKKGKRQPSLKTVLLDPSTQWTKCEIDWYGGKRRIVEIATGTALWYTPGYDPLPIRWVLVRDPAGQLSTKAHFSTDLEQSPLEIISDCIKRWSIEVTFEEMRAYLGLETQRHWSVRAIERTTPCLMGLFSLVVLIAFTLHPQQLPVRQASWYPKQEATFSDALAAVRSDLWRSVNCSTSAQDADRLLIPRATLQALLEMACYST